MAAMGVRHRRCRGVERSHQSMVSASAAIRSRTPAISSSWLPPAAGEAERPEFPGRAGVVVDRFIHDVGVDLAGAIAIHRRCDIGKQSGQLRLVVGAHPFAGGPPFSFGAHDLGRYRVMADPARVTAGRATSIPPPGRWWLLPPLGRPGLKRALGGFMATTRCRIAGLRRRRPAQLTDARNAA
jgi:hypothetical protein